MNTALNIIAIVSGIVGTIGGVLGIVAWTVTRRSRQDEKRYEEWIDGLVEVLSTEHALEDSDHRTRPAKVTYPGVKVVMSLGGGVYHATIEPDHRKWAARGVAESRLAWEHRDGRTVRLP